MYRLLFARERKGNFLRQDNKRVGFDPEVSIEELQKFYEACWRRDSTSHRYGLGSTPNPGRMWNVFHPSQPMPGGFPLGFSSTLRRAQKRFSSN